MIRRIAIAPQSPPRIVHVLTEKRPLPKTVATAPASSPAHTGIYAKWEVVDGKLTCIWLKQPN